MKKDLFLDSSIFIEFFKQNPKAIEIFEFILDNIENFRININAIVWSQIIEIAENLIGELYSNDALNFATVYYFKIDFFITLDNDFKSNEDIKVIHSLKELKEAI